MRDDYLEEYYYRKGIETARNEGLVIGGLTTGFTLYLTYLPISASLPYPLSLILSLLISGVTGTFVGKRHYDKETSRLTDEYIRRSRERAGIR